MEAVSSPGAALTRPRLRVRLSIVQLMLGLSTLALAQRLTGLSTRPLWLDEAFSAWFSNQSFHYLWHVLPTYEAHPPLYYSLLKSWRLVFGGGPIALRSLSVLIGTATIPVVMLIALEQEAQEPTGRSTIRAGIAGLLAACSPMFIVLDKEPRPYPLLVLAYSLAILAMLHLLREFRAYRPGSWKWWALLGFSATLTCWSHALGALYGLCLALALLPAWVGTGFDRTRITRGVVTAAAIGLAYLPCVYLLSSRAHDWGTNWIEWEPGALLQLLVLYSIPAEAVTIASLIVAPAIVLLVKRALTFTWRSKDWNSDRLMLLLWLGPPLVAALISVVYEPVFLARTLCGVLVPGYLLIAGALARTDNGRELRLIAAAIALGLIPTATLVAIRPAEERWDLVSAYLSANVSAPDQVWLYPADSALPLREVGGTIRGALRPIPQPFPTTSFKGPIRAGWPAVVSVTPQQAARFAGDKALKDVPVIWLVTRQSSIFDPSGDVPRALARVRRPGRLQEWGYINVRPYYRR